MTISRHRYSLMSTAAVVTVVFGFSGEGSAQTTCSSQPVSGSTGMICSNAGQLVATGTSTATVGGGTNGQGLTLTSSGNQVTNQVITGGYETSTDRGITAISDGSITLSVSGAIRTTGSGGNGDAVFLMPAGTLNASLQDITTTGQNAWGVNWWGGTGGSISVRDVRTGGGSWAVGVLVDSVQGAINVLARDIRSTGPGVSVSYSAGPLSIVARNIFVTGDAWEGIRIIHGNGAINLDVSSIEVNGRDGAGVYVSGSSKITASLGSVLTTGMNSPGIWIVNGTGGSSVIVGGVSTSGALSHGARIDSQGEVTFSNLGSVKVSGANSYGIDIRAGFSPVTVTTGVVTSTAANAASDASFAAVRIVAAGAAPVTVNANADISTTNGSGIWAQTAGAATVNVAQGVTVYGPMAITLGGTTGNTLNVNGAISSTTAGMGGYTLAGAGPLTLSIGAAGTINGPLTFTAGNDFLTNNRTAGLVQSGATDFGAGNDSFTNSTIFTQNAAIAFGDGNDTVNNTGTYNAVGTTDFGAGTDTFNNAATGTLTAFSGATFTNLEAFNNNAGLIDLRDGASGDILNLGATANYTATGNARLGIDVVGANGVLTSDKLVYGGTTTGTTTVLATIVGSTAVIDAVGALIVDAGTVAAGQFVLGGVTNAGLINYSLETRGSDVFLVSRPDEVVFDQLFAGRMGNDIWYQSAEAYQSYTKSRRVDGNKRKTPASIWAQLYGSRDRFGARDRQTSAFNTPLTTSSRLETKRRGAQGGLDFGLQNFVVGVTAGYEHAQAGSDFGTDLDVKGYNYGAYAQFGAQQGPYAGLLIKRDTYDMRIINMATGAGRIDPEGRSTGIDGEAGFRFGKPGGINFDVGAGLSYVRSRVDDYTFGNVAFDNDRFTSTRGRLQARATFAGAIAPFIDGKIFREFGDANDLTVRSGMGFSRIVDEKRGTWGRIEGGLGGGAGGGPLLSAWVDLGDVRGWGLRGGFRF